jgi:aspartate/methionine/tyrosine aminotransferase
MTHRADLRLAHRASLVPPFYAMDMSRRASEREAAGHGVLHLEVEQPSSPAPSLARRAAADAIERGEPLGYTNAAGLLSLRRRIAQWYADREGVTVDPASVMVVAGASAGFTLAFLALFDAGDRVGVLEPGYPCYRNTLAALGVDVVRIPVGRDTRWAPTAELLDSVGPLDGLVVASPSNPTGTMLDRATLELLREYAATTGTRLVVDEIYRGITYGPPAPSALAVVDSAVVVNSFSKYFSMTGWRLGWLVAPPEVFAAMERLQQNLYICAPHVSQVAGLAAFDCVAELDGHVDRYRSNRAALLAGLAAVGLDQVADADGAFYVYADVGRLVGDGRRVPDAMALCHAWLADCGVACTPGLDFDLERGQRFVRFSYAGALDDIAAACARLGDWVTAR